MHFYTQKTLRFSRANAVGKSTGEARQHERHEHDGDLLGGGQPPVNVRGFVSADRPPRAFARKRSPYKVPCKSTGVQSEDVLAQLAEAVVLDRALGEELLALFECLVQAPVNVWGLVSADRSPCIHIQMISIQNPMQIDWQASRSAAPLGEPASRFVWDFVWR